MSSLSENNSCRKNHEPGDPQRGTNNCGDQQQPDEEPLDGAHRTDGAVNALAYPVLVFHRKKPPAPADSLQGGRRDWQGPLHNPAQSKKKCAPAENRREVERGKGARGRKR